MHANESAIFTPVTIGNVTFKNRLLRSSLGGRTAYYDGTVNEAWETFESRFASGGVAGIISATLTVDHDRWAPLEYPAISHDKYIGPLSEKIGRLKKRYDCHYIIQVGDPGYHTQTSLLSQQHADGATASSGFDPLYGYTNRRRQMPVPEIKRTVENFAKAARRVKAIGCDGIELTISKGYLIHQFLNPGTNRRSDEYGGSLEDRCRLLKEVVEAIRDAVEGKFLFGVRLSARDYNRHPWPALARFGPGLWPSALTRGNDLPDMLEVAGWLERLGVNYLHISSGFGFINPKENPGAFPTPEVRMFCDSTRHLGSKARTRALWLQLCPERLLNYLLNIGWPKPDPQTDFANRITNLDDALEFKRKLPNMTVIVNGGFQNRSYVEGALASGCDMVSMGRPLLANPRLPKMFEHNIERPKQPCTFCNRCTVRTTLFPLACYDLERFRVDRLGRRRTDDVAQEAMERQIERFNRPRPRV